MSAPRLADVENVLVFRIGQLGDTIVALPAFWAVRERFRGARMTLLCDRQIGKDYVLAPDLLEGTGLFDDYITYGFDTSPRGRLFRPLRMLALLRRLRARRFDTVVYLAPSIRTPAQVARDRRFFARAGVRRFVGFEGFYDLPRKTPGVPMPAAPLEVDLLLARVEASGIPVPPPGRGRMDLSLGAKESDEVGAWLRELPSDGGRRWLGVGPGSKMPVKIWPEERFERVVRALIEEADVWPVVFGGPEDRPMGERLIARWERGYNAAGRLSLRASASALARCRLHLGNDTGPMHLAAAAGIPCVAVFSSREMPGAWYPYGDGHRIFRTEIECDGCRLFVCIERAMECILAIRAEDVLEACRGILNREAARSGG